MEGRVGERVGLWLFGLCMMSVVVNEKVTHFVLLWN